MDQWEAMKVAIPLCLSMFPQEALESLAKGDEEALATFQFYALDVLNRRAMASKAEHN